ncbi:MAG: hypothetical protein WD609_03955 [Aquisalimonadaceae bacterium]
MLRHLELPVFIGKTNGAEPILVQALSPSQVYFSVYELWPRPPAHWEQNRLTWLRERITATREVSNEVHFLGAPLVERDGVSEARYLSWLTKIRDGHPGRDFVYVLHPSESESFAQRISMNLDMITRRYDLPYEVELCLMRSRPSVIASWFCSALDNLAAAGIPDLLLQAYRLPPVKLPRRKQRQAVIFEAAEQFYRRHEGGGRVMVCPIPEADRIREA